MASIATITAATPKVQVKAGQTAQHTFTITNTTDATLTYSIKAVAEGAAEAAWLVCEGPAERQLSAGESEQVTVRVEPPEDARAEEYTFHLLAFSSERPGEDFTESPTVAFEVSPIQNGNGGLPWKWIAIAAGVVVLLVGGGLGAWHWMHPELTVPNVEGKPLAEASTILEEAGFQAGDPTYEVAEDTAPDHVIRQRPEPDEEVPEPGAEEPPPVVALWVAEEPKVEAPDVVGKKLGVARNAFDEAGLEVGAVTANRTLAEARNNEVTAQAPSGGSMLERGSKIDLTILEYPDTVAVPDVRKETKAKAFERIEDAGLVPKEGDYQETDLQPAGTVFRQSPIPDTRIAPGSEVEVSIAKAVPKVTVPNVQGQDRVTATATLNDIGLDPKVTYKELANWEPGQVASQRPGAGNRVKKGSPVHLTVASKISTTTVPSLKGLTLDQAKSRLSRSRLSVGKVSRKVGGGDNTIIAQSPSAGSKMRAGGVVNVTIHTKWQIKEPVIIDQPILKDRPLREYEIK